MDIDSESVEILNTLSPKEIQSKKSGDIFINIFSERKLNLLKIQGTLNFQVLITKDGQTVSKYEESFQIEQFSIGL